MRCPKCRTLTLLAASEILEAGSLVRCPRCPAVWVVRPEADGLLGSAVPPPVTRRGPLIIEAAAVPGRDPARAPRAPAAAGQRVELRRYGIAAGAAVLMLALVAVVLLAPDVSALPDVAFLEGSR
jgi:predicted Zn finger-like uncharacterized protein